MRVLLVLIAMTVPQGPPPAMPEWARERPYASSGSHIASPTVVATWMVDVHKDVHSLDLLVVWRGTPGWFLEGQGHRSSGVGSADTTSVTIEYAGRPLTVVLDRKARLATVQSRPVDLNPDLDVLKRSDRLLPFLQCDLTVPQASAQRTIEMLCAQAMGR